MDFYKFVNENFGGIEEGMSVHSSLSIYPWRDARDQFSPAGKHYKRFDYHLPNSLAQALLHSIQTSTHLYNGTVFCIDLDTVCENDSVYFQFRRDSRPETNSTTNLPLILLNSPSEATPKGGLGTTVQILGWTIRHNGSLLFHIAFQSFPTDDQNTPEINLWSQSLAKPQELVLIQANSGTLVKWSDRTPRSITNQPWVVRSLELVPLKDSPDSVLCIATRALTALEVQQLAAIFGSINDFQERKRDESFRIAHRLYEITYTNRNSAILVHGLEFNALEFTSSVPSLDERAQILWQAKKSSNLLVGEDLLVYCGIELGSVQYHTKLSATATRDVASLIDAKISKNMATESPAPSPVPSRSGSLSSAHASDAEAESDPDEQRATSKAAHEARDQANHFEPAHQQEKEKTKKNKKDKTATAKNTKKDTKERDRDRDRRRRQREEDKPREEDRLRRRARSSSA